MITPATFRLGMAQTLVEGGQPAANLDRATAAVAQLASDGCRIVVLPECLDLGWTHPSARDLAQPMPGPHVARLATAARENRVYVAAGLVERAGEKRYNSAVLLDPRGQIVLHYRKINELDIAFDLYAQGDRLGVVDTELGRLGLDICADNFSDSLALAHSLARMGAHTIVSPSAWAVPAEHDNRSERYGQLWRDAYGEITTLYDLHVIGVSNVGWLTAGPWQGRKCIGCSLAMGPGGRILAEGPYGDAAVANIIVEIAPRVPTLRGTQIAPALAERGYRGP